MTCRARVNLGQIERWSPATDRDRRMKALNLVQVKAYIERGCTCPAKHGAA